jgi:cation diffusion facilitator CzcD-associated flavoprotein CzcO
MVSEASLYNSKHSTPLHLQHGKDRCFSLKKMDIRSDPRAAAKYGWQSTNEHGYTILEQPLGVLAPRKIICIGAGATGICLAKFAESVPNLSIQVYDKNSDVAGTWTENRYPGVACDIPAHVYQFQWALNPNWSAFYATGSEILEYFRGVVEQHGLLKYMKLQHKVVSASWDSEKGEWAVEVEAADGTRFRDTCDFLVNGTGLLNAWKWPKINGLESFRGTLAHSANYDPSTNIVGKRVAVFGSGSSGVQIVANIQPKVGHLYHWIRSPIWISSGFAADYAGPEGRNFEYSPEIQKWFANRDNHMRYVKMIEDDLGKKFTFGLKNTPDAELAVQFARAEMEKKLKGRPDLLQKILPTSYGVGCRRPTPGCGYLEALTTSNVTTYTQEVREISAKGFIDSQGDEHEVDIIICATGFDTSHIPPYSITANGKDLRKVWEKGSVSYFSVMVPEFPNYFMQAGPYSAANGSLLPALEQSCRYIMQVVQKCQAEHIKSVAPKMQAMLDFQEHADLFNKRTVLTQPCRSWMKNGTVDAPPSIYPGSRTHFMEMLQPRYEDFEMEYEKRNRYYFMGNGFATRDMDDRDATWYFGLLDGQDKQPDYSKCAEKVFALSRVLKVAQNHEANGHHEAVVTNGVLHV